MTDTIEPTITVPQNIIDDDFDLRGDLKRADGSLKTAKERRAAALAELNQFRWEMTVCEHGPQFSQHDYAKAVGQGSNTIKRGVDAWQATLDADKPRQSGAVCAYGGEPHHIPEVKVPKKTKPTEEQAKKHGEQRRIAEHGEIKAEVIKLIALHFEVAENTVERHRRPLVNDALSRLRDNHDISEMTIEEIKPLITEIVRTLRQEDKLRIRRESDVKRWMAINRGVSVGEIKAKDVESKMQRIESVMARKEISWDEAEAEVREADYKAVAATREKNEMARQARLAILDLVAASSDVRAAAVKVTKAMKAIEDAHIVITDDERTISVDDLDQAEAAIHLARAALTGDSGTDWDAALASLNQQRDG